MPARTPAKEAIALAVLLVVLAAVVIYQLRNFGASGGPGRPAQARPESSRTAAARDRAAAVPDVRLLALKALASAPEPSIGRNPFREKPPAPPAPLAGAAAADSVVGPQPPPQPPPPPPITLKLVAIVRGSGLPIAALTDGRDVFYGREGEVIEGRYRILKINVESIDISYVDGRGQRRIGLTG